VVANNFGLACLDVRQVFLNKRLTGNITEWMGDSVHPNALGHQQWLKVVTRALENKQKSNSCKLNPLVSQQRNPITNPYFYDWVWTNELPVGFTKLNNVTVTKDSLINETLSWSLKAVNNSNSLGEIRFDLAQYLPDRQSGSSATLCVRLYITNGSTLNAGRVELTSNLGSQSSAPYTEVRDGWTWRIVNLSPEFLDGATTLRGSIYIGSSVGDTVYVDRLQIVSGSLPADTYFTPVKLSNYYFPQSVGGVGGAMLTVTGNQVNVTDTPAAFAEFFINVNGLEVGKQYTVTWTSPATLGSATVFTASGRTGDTITTTTITTNTLTWTASAQSNSISFNANTGTKTLLVSGLSIVGV
jgi:hypothetical protein